MKTLEKKESKEVTKRKKQHELLTRELLKRLHLILELENDTQIRFSANSLELFVMKKDKKDEKLFASDISFFNSTDWGTQKDNLELNFGSSGSFTPKDRAPFVRTRHAMEVLNNWEEVSTLILRFMKQLQRLQDTWRFEREVLETK